jgi:hypothetical protein
MTDNVNKKYERNRSNWRKVYSFQRRKPNIVNLIDTFTSESFSYDLQQTVRNRDFFILSKEIPFDTAPAIVFPTEYDEGIFTFPSITDSGTGSFNFTFSTTPYVVLTIESASLYGPNVNLFGRTVSTSGFTFGTSAPFTGSIRWRAIYSPTYPAYVSSAYTSSITASAGQTTPGGNSYYTASFAALPDVPFTFLDTAWENIGIADGSSNAAFIHETSSSNSATIDITSPMNSTIDFIAFYQTVATGSGDFLIDDASSIFVDDGGNSIIYG